MKQHCTKNGGGEGCGDGSVGRYRMPGEGANRQAADNAASACRGRGSARAESERGLGPDVGAPDVCEFEDGSEELLITERVGSSRVAPEVLLNDLQRFGVVKVRVQHFAQADHQP